MSVCMLYVFLTTNFVICVLFQPNFRVLRAIFFNFTQHEPIWGGGVKAHFQLKRRKFCGAFFTFAPPPLKCFLSPKNSGTGSAIWGRAGGRVRDGGGGHGGPSK